ncbi:MAG: VPLPA-CTERM sorting domain-containing protein [Paracoccaceae bacterium]
MRRQLIAAVAATFALTLGGFAADAATCTSAWGKNKSKARTFEMSTLNTAVESYCGAGRSNAQSLDGVFSGSGSWVLADVERSRASAKANRRFRATNSGDGFIDLSMNAARDLESGTWSIDQFPVATQVMVVLRSGRGFAAFMLEPFMLTGDWVTSHQLRVAALFYRSCQPGTPGCGAGNGTPTPAPVPLPAAGALMLGGLGGLFALRRRRKKA